jgi:hypothetical protein
MARIGMLTEEQFADQFAPTLAPPIGVELSGTFQAKDPQLDALATFTWTAGSQVPVFTAATTVVARSIGAAAGSDILDRDAADGRYTLTTALSESIDDRVAALIQNGTGITWTYNDAAGTLTPAVTITQYTDEQARDAIGTALLGTTNQITVTVNDGADTITASLPNAVTLPGSLAVTTTFSCNSGATLGDAAGDVHAINGATTQTVNANGQQGLNITDGTVNLRITPSDATGVARIGTTTNHTLSLIRNGGILVTLGASSVDVATALLGSSSIKSSGATQGVGYATGAGGTVTQATSKSTGVTLNKCCGEITLNGAALASATVVSFVLTNSAIAATDNIILNHTATGTFGAYLLNGRCAAGSATIDVRNVTAGSLSEAIVIRFTVLKGVTA